MANKTKDCCNKPMEAKSISENRRNGCGTLNYAILCQCKKCGKIAVCTYDHEEDDVLVSGGDE